MYFVINKDNAKILSHYETKPEFSFDGAIVAELANITINETVIDWGNNQTSIQYSYTPDTVDLAAFKQGATNEVLSTSTTISEVALSNGLIFDDTEKSLNYLQTKRATSNASEVVYDKYNTSATMSNSELTAAVSVIATSQMSKDDIYKEKVAAITNASSIEEVKDLAGIHQEKTIKLIVDVDGANFDSTNQVTSEELNQVVMADGGVDLSAIGWINAVGVKSINEQTKLVEVIDSNFVNTAQIALSQESPSINGIIKADGLPVQLTMIVYCRNSQNETMIAS